MIVYFTNIALLLMLAITALLINLQRNLLAAVMLSGIYSLLCASLFVCLDAVDVAFTEASVGAGVATILFLGALAQTDYHKQSARHRSFSGLLIVLVCGLFLLYGLSDMPEFGAAENPVQTYLAQAYLIDSRQQIGVPNLVTAVLSSYRGYDTLGETTVIFTAGIAVLMLLGRGQRDKGTSAMEVP